MEERSGLTLPTGACASLLLRDVSKSYGATQALDGVTLEVARGSIHALVGGNGSGKSTLIKALAGVVVADAGQLERGETTVDLRSHSPAKARALDLHFVHQQSSTFTQLTVAENLSLGRGFESGLAGRIRWSAVKRRAARVLDVFQIQASPDDELGQLGSATQMMVAIARALQDQSEDAQNAVLVLDEPTASLPPHEVDVILSALQRYAASGHTILYVTHRLREVLSVADRGTVLRDGKVVGDFAPGQIGHDELVTMIMGTPIEASVPRGTPQAQANVLLAGAGLGSGEVQLEIRSGEVLGLAGILGSGRTTLLRQLFGAASARHSTLTMNGRTVVFHGPRQAMRAGLTYLPEDRPRDALFPDLSVAENLSVANLAAHSRFGRISRSRERRTAREVIRAFSVVAASETASVGSLSGGNQQKLMLARWLQRNPRILLLDEPTQGVDAGARAEIHALVRNAVNDGAGAVLVSSDFEELAAASDRVIVLQAGRAVAHLKHRDVDEAKINALVYSEETS